jgi:hypothetical protein
MEDKLEVLLDKIRKLETEFRMEIQKKEQEFYYHVKRNRVRFEREVKARHKLLMERIPPYLLHARPMAIITAPVIWLCLFPMVLLDGVITLYQAVCFPIYKIPKVRRSEYVVLDRQYLSYLNLIEKLNCVYCGYFNGVIGYAAEISARTEQHWCPIKHARRVGSIHSRYKYFMDYGDAERYKQEMETIRREFSDLQNNRT